MKKIFFNQKIKDLFRKVGLLLGLLLLVSTPAFSACKITSLRTNMFGQSSHLPNSMDNVISFDQNALPISFTLEATAYCSKVATITFFPMDSATGYNATFTQLTETILRDLKPSRVEGTITTTITPLRENKTVQSVSNFFTRHTSHAGSTTFYGDQSFRIQAHIPALMLYSAISGNGKEYETGGIIFSLSDEDSIANSIRLTVTLLLQSMRENVCLRGAFKATVDRPAVNFGSISKSEVEAGKIYREPFAINVVKTNNNCKAPIMPRVVFNSGTLYSDTMVDLQNGLVLKLKDEKNREVKFGQASGDGTISGYNSQPLNMKFNAEIQQSPSKGPIKSGDFSSVIIYTMEYY
ncbi:hypothetical protein B9T19_08850 [Ignatzschineria sp. F8392]|uniref:fimbrial protein n=1 Tax=Ignatzschineria sp. F8392 TaxID=1980117 RepID=UPI000B9991FE|nr:hypothetical protein [Ignatzschineria sp. F8392]OYQ78160.1 hypothetical protein B9T19_08850 [Ignatzschineria sp. F8392]